MDGICDGIEWTVESRIELVWNAHPQLPTDQKLLLQMTRLLSSRLRDSSLFDVWRHLAVSQWLEKLPHLLKMIRNCTKIALYCSAAGVVAESKKRFCTLMRVWRAHCKVFWQKEYL